MAGEGSGCGADDKSAVSNRAAGSFCVAVDANDVSAGILNVNSCELRARDPPTSGFVLYSSSLNESADTWAVSIKSRLTPEAPPPDNSLPVALD